MATEWVDDPTLEAPDGHRWVKPAPDDCPDCPCHVARVCRERRWAQATRPRYPNGQLYTKPCPCEQRPAVPAEEPQEVNEANA